MTLRVGTSFQIERRPRDLAGTVPVEAYLMDKAGSPGTYVLGSGDKAGEASAFLQDNGSGVYVLNDDPAEEDRKMYLVTSTTVVL